ncbi:hypothetical protein [Pseudonocardia sp.]|uniref:hypothetical protein n=1 Tax=Pseudonocardia sp. TaxID=60912 RepID=UPI003D125999
MVSSTPADEPRPRESDADGDGRFAWEAGAPGFAPVDPDRLTPHAPMPGAPPYPAAEELPPPSIGATATGTPLRRTMPAAVGWGVVNVVLVLAVSGPPPSSSAGWALGGMIVASVLVAGVLTWVVARRRAWPFWVVILVTGLLFWIVRVATTAGVA